MRSLRRPCGSSGRESVATPSDATGVECRARGPPVVLRPEHLDQLTDVVDQLRSGRVVRLTLDGFADRAERRRAFAFLAGRGVRARDRNRDRRTHRRHDRAAIHVRRRPDDSRSGVAHARHRSANGNRAEGRHRREATCALCDLARRRSRVRTTAGDGAQARRQSHLVAAGDGVLALPHDDPALAVRTGMVFGMRTVGAPQRRVALRRALRLNHATAPDSPPCHDRLRGRPRSRARCASRARADRHRRRRRPRRDVDAPRAELVGQRGVGLGIARDDDRGGGGLVITRRGRASAPHRR